MATLTCPHCGEPIDTFPDRGGGPAQEHIEDCAVCCRPMLVIATLDENGDEYVAVASPET